jgi:hypothetical protein
MLSAFEIEFKINDLFIVKIMQENVICFQKAKRKKCWITYANNINTKAMISNG